MKTANLLGCNCCKNSNALLFFRDVKLEFFSKSKLGSKKSIKSRNSFPVRTDETSGGGRASGGMVGGLWSVWWSPGDGSEPAAASDM